MSFSYKEDKMDKKALYDLIEKAQEASKNSYSPYSNFSVGAALVDKNGNYYTGANIENASFAATVCAERVAFFKAITSGAKDFLAMAVVGSNAGAPISRFCAPCGVCRQVMAEFCDGDFEIVLYNGADVKCINLNDLLPYRFELSVNKDTEGCK